MKTFVCFFLAMFLARPVVLQANHTHEDQMLLARSVLRLVRSSARDNLMDLSIVRSPRRFDTWEEFVGPGTAEWTMEDRKEAFGAYLAWLGETNMTVLDGMEKSLACIAISKCRTLSFTNAVPALKAIGLNPNGLYRSDAISLAVTLSPLDTDLVGFVETVMTNKVSFTLRERGAATAKLAKKILTVNGNVADDSVLRQATVMLYRNRHVGTAGALMLDRLFCSKYEGYATSSNRLSFAHFILNHPEHEYYDVRDFSSITNQLLSSGQPLRQLTISDGGNE